jgi:hypothetical protein
MFCKPRLSRLTLCTAQRTPSICMVPKLTRLKPGQASRAFANAGGRLGKLRRPVHTTRHRPLRVVSQSARVGSRHPTGHIVSITFR